MQSEVEQLVRLAERYHGKMLRPAIAMVSALASETLSGNPQPIDTADPRFRRVATDGVTEDELGQAVNKATAELIMQSERPGNRLFGLGTRWLLKREYHSLDQSLDKLRALTAGSIRAAAQRYLDAPSHVVRAGG